MKKVIKFKYLDQEGFLSVVEKDKQLYTLVKKETPKVLAIQKNHKLQISYDLKNPVYKEVTAHIKFDHDVVEWVYRALESEGNLYFKQLDDSLCALIIEVMKN